MLLWYLRKLTFLLHILLILYLILFVNVLYILLTLLWPPMVIRRPLCFAVLMVSIYLSFFQISFLFLLAYSHGSEIGCLPYIHTCCRLSANLECMSEMCCLRLAENTGRKNYAKNRHLHTTAQIGRAISSKLRHRQSEKKLLNASISSTSPHNMVHVGPLTTEIGSGVWGTPANFNGFRVLASLLQ